MAPGDVEDNAPLGLSRNVGCLMFSEKFVISTSFRNYVSHLHDISEAETYTYARSQFSGSDEEFADLARKYAEVAPEKNGSFYLLMIYRSKKHRFR